MPRWQPEHPIIETDGVWHRTDCPHTAGGEVLVERGAGVIYELPRAPVRCDRCCPEYLMRLGR